MKYILVLLIAFNIAKADVISTDKLYHTLVGGVIYAGCLIINKELDYNIDNKWCLLPPLFAAVGKEMYDYHSYGGFDLEDIGATMSIPSASFIVYEW